jgi:arabinofuranosyltransferase
LIRIRERIFAIVNISEPDPEQQAEAIGSKNFLRVLLFLLVLIFMLIVIRRAWMGDDAYITLRTVDNFVSGYGLRFNVSERVQSFTHPLWMFLLSGFYFFTRESYFTTLTVSLLCMLAAILIFTFRVARSQWAALIGLVVLTMSNAFVDYSTSGLENPLTDLLLVIFFMLYLKKEFSPKNIFWLSFIASLAGFNRLDTLLFYFPPLVAAWLFSRDKKKTMLMGILGQAPLVLWEIFSLFYYGFLFPNTYYSKLGTGIPRPEMLTQGVYYYLNSLQRDPITLLVILFGVVAGLFFLRRNRWRVAPISIGIFLYLVYILRIGGDFMSGRFFAAPFFLAAILLSQFAIDSLSTEVKYLALAVPLLLGLSATLPTYMLTSPDVSHSESGEGITDERLWYFPSMGLLKQSRRYEVPFYNYRRIGEEFKLITENTGQYVYLEGPIGMAGYYAGPTIHLIDHYGLVDPLRAHLPMTYKHGWRVAHYIRWEQIEGYDETIVTGENHLVDSGLRTYYNYLSLIVKGPLWNWQRFKTIVNMNLGKFDYLIDEFKYRYPEVVEKTYAKVNDFHQLPINSCDSEDVVRFKDHGLLIKLPEDLQHSKTLTLAIDNNQRFQVLFYKERAVVGRLVIYPTRAEGIQYARSLAVPRSAIESGYDEIHILPLSGGPFYCSAYVQLK